MDRARFSFYIIKKKKKKKKEKRGEMERNNICKSCNFEYWNCIRYIVESCRSLIGRVRAMTFHVTNIGASKMEEQINLSLFFGGTLAYFDFSNLFMQAFILFSWTVYQPYWDLASFCRWNTSNPIFLKVSRRDAGCIATSLLPWFSQDASGGFKRDPVVSTATNETSYNSQHRGSLDQGA